MVAQISDALAAYRSAAKQATGEGMEAREAPAGKNFGDFVRDSIDGAMQAGKAGEAVSQGALLGQADMTDVVLAVNNAELSLQTVVSIRDKVIDAYRQIIQMPI